ncbi:hypothetical protein KC365_g17055 [Hortaea werneckii]|nr:hypothetical protein KC342_g15238 [Hortaea werneckii]KAI7062772.1 hypothetical protein KC339_g16475 [Hortaea werneckii]KAI7206595.1 hypothetical protein KC365_g17055 [Hortaea werneckii]
MRTKNDLLKLAALLLAAARVEAAHVELCTVQVYQTCGTPTLTKTLSFPQSFSYTSNITSTMAASSSSAPSSGGYSTCSTSSSVSSYIEPSVPPSSTSIAPPPVSTTPILSTSGSVTFTSTPSPSSSSTSSILSSSSPVILGDIYLDTITDHLFIGSTSSGLYASSRAQYFQLSDIHLHAITDYLLFLRGTSSYLYSSSSTEHIERNHLHFDAIADSFLFIRGTTSYLHTSTGAQHFELGDLHFDAFPDYFFLIGGPSSDLHAPSRSDCVSGIETDAEGVQYEVQCGSDTTGGNQGTPYGTTNRLTSYRDCFAICNDTPLCQGFVWVGGTNSYGNGPGNCYFKSTGVPDETITFVPANDPSRVACIRIVNPGPPVTSTQSSTVSSSSAGEPPIYTTPAEITTTTTTTTTTSTSSSSSVESPPIYTPPVQPTTTTTTTTTSTSSTSSSLEVPPIYTPPPQPTTTTFTTTTTNASSSSSSAPAGPSCPYAPDTVITDDNGIDYAVRCNADTTGGGVGDSYPTCRGFVWLGALNSYGSGAGNCYFKGSDPEQTIAFTNSDSAHFAAIKVNQGGPVVPPAVTTTTTTTTTSSSSSVAIVVPPTTTTTTTTTSTSSSSTITSRVIYTPPPPTQISTSVSSTTSITFPSQPARLSCARQGYLVQNFNWFVVEIATGNTVQNGTIQGGIPMQAMGYNRCDGLIYATDQEAYLVRFGLDLTPQRLYEQTFFRYQTGEVDNDCQYWAIRTADNDVARWIHVDVNPASPVYGSIVGQGELAVPQYFYADWAYVPGAGSYLWSVGIDQPTANAYLYRFDQATLTSTIVASFGDIGLADFRPDPASGYRLNFGAVYASADGYLYGSENISGNIYRFTVAEPYNWQFLVQGPGTVQNDGARCIDNTEAIGTY